MIRRIKEVFCVILLAVSVNTAFAQSGTVSGTVTNQSGNPLVGANIVIDGTNFGAATNMAGEYEITGVSSGDYSFTASYIGYKQSTQSSSVTPGGATTLDFVMSPSAVGLDEVIVTGTAGAASRREIGNSVGTLRPDAIGNQPSATLTEALYAQTTGLTQMRNEGQVGGGSRIMLRGMNSISQDVQPLVYIDCPFPVRPRSGLPQLFWGLLPRVK